MSIERELKAQEVFERLDEVIQALGALKMALTELISAPEPELDEEEGV